MMDTDFSEIFAELTDEHEAERELLAALADLVPGGGLLFLAEDGTRLTAGAAFPLPPEREAELLRQLAPGGEELAAFRLHAGWLYLLTVEGFAGELCWWLPGELDLRREPAGRALLQNSLRYALDEQQRREAAAQDEQYRRQIEVLKQQHGRLVEDNYRQYRINREKEQDYARKLESEIARQTAELREANRRLEESSRLKSEFLANMSHELRTPLNAIIGFADLLADTSLDQDQDEYCHTIRQSSRALLALINDILDLAKIEAGRLDLEVISFDLDELLASVAAMFSLSAREKGVTLEVHRDPDLPATLRGDSHRLRQVLINLVGNAFKFTKEGGIRLRVERVPPSTVGGAREEGPAPVALRFAVQDSGIGIPTHRLEAVFDKFTQADGSTTRRFGGTGLGLAICRQLVELMGGEIRVESQEGEGSTFSFNLTMPVAGEASAPAVAEPVDAAGPAAMEKVLLVEDNPVNQRLASLMIEKQGCRVTVAADGLEALERLREEEFDLVLMDVQMPRMDGLSATREIRAIEADPERRREYAALARCSGSSQPGQPGPPIPIVGLTAHARKEDEEACYAAGMNAFLSKPIVRPKLLAVLNGSGIAR